MQISSAWLLAVFFVVLQRSSAAAELQLWTQAWLANALALLVTFVYWSSPPTGEFAPRLLLALYLGGKSGFVMLLWLGTRRFVGQPLPGLRRWWFGILGLAALTALWRPGMNALGMLQCSLIALGFGLAGLTCLRARRRELAWLGIGFALRASLAVAEGLAYAWRGWVGLDGVPAALNRFIAAHSSFDTGAEWVIALGCVLALAQRALAELREGHLELRAAHAELTWVAERDPLTGLHNRRMLPNLLQQAASGDLLLFFDLDGFKPINDRYGHDIGDQCLRRFAAELSAVFPHAQGSLRFAGDEFVLLLPASSHGRLAADLGDLRRRLQASDPALPAISFSVGTVPIEAGQDDATLLRAADQAMYRNKAFRRQSGA